MFDTRTVEQALVRICGPNRTTKGSGFFINNSGLILTCDHVLGQLTEVLVQTPDGQHHPVRCTSHYRFPEVDLAIIATDLSPTSPLPIDFGYEVGKRVWTKGFQYQSYNLTAAFPLQATISGTTSIRYKTETQLYQLEKVLVLTEAEVDEGLSGAPLIDEETGVVIGVVNTTFRKGGGFALPFLSEAKYQTPLREIIEWNRVHIRRYGRFLNVAGAHFICKSQVKAALHRLEKEGLFLPNLSFERPALSQEINRFLQGDALILPIIGEAGTGKTTLLALLADSLLEKRPCLLLRASLIDSGGKSLRNAVEDLLRLKSGNTLTNIDRFTQALTLSQQQLLILLDGLNEVPPPLRENITAWIQQSIYWLEKVSAQLVVTSRPVFWDLTKRYFPSRLLYVIENSRSGSSIRDSSLPVDNFTIEEAKTALRIYGLEKGGITTKDIQHPLLARISWELRQQTHDQSIAPATLYAVFKEFVKRKCEQVALMANTSPIFVQHLLLKTAKWTYQSGQYTIDLDFFFSQELFGMERLIGEKLLAENVFVETPAGLRFAFDEVAEFLQGERLDDDDIEEWLATEDLIALQKGGNSTRLSAVIFAILRFDHQENLATVEHIIARLVDVYVVHPSNSLALELVRLFSQLSQPEIVLSSICKFAAKAVDAISPFRTAQSDNLLLLMPTLGLSTNTKFSIFQVLARSESYYHWESARKWEREIPTLLKYERSFVTIISEDIKRNPVQCFQQLLTWLDDDSPLCGRQQSGRQQIRDQTVRDVALGLLFYFRDLAFEDLCEMLAESDEKDAGHLLALLAEKDPQLMLSVCEQWANSPDDQRQDLAAHLSYKVLISPYISENETKRLIAFFRKLLETTTSLDIIYNALGSLYLIEEEREAVLSEVVTGFLSDKPYLTAHLLCAGLRTHFDPIIDAFRLALQSKDDEKKRKISGALHLYIGTDYQNEIILNIFESLLLVENDDAIIFQVAYYIEDKLYNIGLDSNLFNRIIAFTKKFIRQKGAFAALIFGTIGKDHPDTIEERAKLLDYMIAHVDDLGSLGLILRELAYHASITPNVFDRLLAVGEKMSQVKFEAHLIFWAWKVPSFAITLAEFLQNSSRVVPKFKARAFCILIEKGYPPPEAARILFADKNSL